LLILTLYIVNLSGIKQSILFNNILTTIKIFTLLFFVGTGLFFIKAENFDFKTPVSFESFSASVLLMVYAFSGFTGALTTGGEMKNPQKDIPFSLISVQVFKVILYMLIQVVCIGTLSTLAQSEKPLADAAANFLQGWGGIAITIGALISFTATLNGGVLVASRTCYGLAEKNLLPSFLGKVHHRFQTPHMSLLFTCAIMLILTLTNSLLFLLTVNALGTLCIYVMACAALLKLRKKKDIPAAAYILPGGNIIASISILICILIMSGSTGQQVLYIAGVLTAGATVYGVFVFSRKKIILQTEAKG
jgi:amino acid transporter